LSVSEETVTTEHASAVRHSETKRNGVPSLLKDAAAAYSLHLESYTPARLASSSDARIVLNEFRKVTGVIYASKITRADILKFCAALAERGNGPRTVYNKFRRLIAFLHFAKVTVDGLQKSDRPTFEEKKIDTYDAEQMTALRNAADDYMCLAIDMAQQMGLRYQELIHAEWADLSQCIYTVRGHDYRGTSRGYEFKVKDKEQRTVPVNVDLCARLQAWKAAHPGTVLILGTASDRPNTHLLRQLKRMAKNADLNCGKCKGCESGECKEWTLHRFRRTYLTTLLRNGADLKTVQKMAGHSDLASTQRYLDAMTAENVLPLVNKIQW
jgi:integrase